MPQTLSHPPPQASQAEAPNTRHVLIYFITGNPGLIDYYEPFLSTLRTLLDGPPSTSTTTHPTALHIHGRNLAGFDDDDDNDAATDPHQPPHDLESQIHHVLSALTSHTVPTPGPRHSTPFDNVILIGHSVGAYILLETFHRRPPGLNLTAGILLFPTVTHISLSPAGRRLTLLTSTIAPTLLTPALSLARAAASLAPDALLSFLLQGPLGGRHSRAAAGVTARFLRSRGGIRQALHLGADEMRVIGEEVWPEELWEVAGGDDDGGEKVGGVVDLEEEEEVPKFFFYFGEKDQWVAEECRDRFIEKRREHASREGERRRRGRTRIVVDEDGIPHAFCISE